MNALFTSALALGLGISSVALAAPPTITRYQSRGDTAYANASSSSDCTSVYLDVSASEDVTRASGDRTTTKSAWVSYYAYDWCTQTEASGWAELPLTADVNTRAVSLSFSLPVTSYTYEENGEGYWDYVELGTETLSGSVTITGSGTMQRGTNSYSSSWGKNRSTYRWTGSYRDATVALSATLDGAPLSFDTTSGSLGTYSSGSVDFYRQ